MNEMDYLLLIHSEKKQLGADYETFDYIFTKKPIIVISMEKQKQGN